MPRIQMTRTVRLALFFLRVYLIVLLALILLKFVRSFSGSAPPQRPTAAQSPGGTSDNSPTPPRLLR